MSIEAAIRAELGATEDVTDITTRIYPVAPPQNPVLPYVRYQFVSRVPFHSMTRDSSLQISRLQVDCVAATYAGALALAGAVRVALHMKRGIIGVSPNDGQVSLLKLDDQTDDYENPSGEGTQYGPFRVIQDYTVIHPT
jgi:hypothetical protein